MEEKACLGRQEEVFDLDDIVEQGDTAEHSAPDDAADTIIDLTDALSGPEPVMPQDAEDDIVELMPDDIADAPLTLPGMEDEPAPEVAGALFPAPAETEEEPADSMEGSSELTPAEAGVSEAQAVPCGELPHSTADEEREAFLSLAAEMEARLNELAARHETESRIFAERLTAAEQRFAELDAFAEEQERRHGAERIALEERLAAAEQRNIALEGRAEELEKQLAECSSFFLDDAAFRLGLEGMVSAMLDARMASGVPVQDGPIEAEPAEDAGVASAGQTEGLCVSESIADAAAENAVEEALSEETEAEAVSSDDVEPADVQTEHGAVDCADENEAVCLPDEAAVPAVNGNDDEFAEDTAAELDEALSARIIEIEEHVGELDARMAEWELRCEQEAARAASRVIREEIAALRAEAARSGR